MTIRNPDKKLTRKPHAGLFLIHRHCSSNQGYAKVPLYDELSYSLYGVALPKLSFSIYKFHFLTRETYSKYSKYVQKYDALIVPFI